MVKLATKSAFTIGLLCMLLSLPAFAVSINKSVKIEAGTESGGATSVNGSISVGEDAVVDGGLKTVNGTIRIDEGARVENASTVNGSLRLADNVQAHSLSTVNGAVKIGEAVVVDGDVSAVNGRITVEKGSRVAADVGNVNGEINSLREQRRRRPRGRREAVRVELGQGKEPQTPGRDRSRMSCGRRHQPGAGGEAVHQ